MALLLISSSEILFSEVKNMSASKCEYVGTRNGKRVKCRNMALTEDGLCKIHGNVSKTVVGTEETTRTSGVSLYREAIVDVHADSSNKDKEAQTVPQSLPQTVCSS